LGPLRILSGTEVCRIIAENGFVEARRRGRYSAMQMSTTEGTLTVPVPLHAELKRDTLASIIRQPGLPRSLFEE